MPDPRTTTQPLFRLVLACGHVAYALESEERYEGRPRPCYACGETAWRRIDTVEALSVEVPRVPKRQRCSPVLLVDDDLRGLR